MVFINCTLLNYVKYNVIKSRVHKILIVSCICFRYGQTEETQVGASLENGELLVHLRFNQTPENYTVGGTRLDNGHLHLIEVISTNVLSFVGFFCLTDYINVCKC